MDGAFVVDSKQTIDHRLSGRTESMRSEKTQPQPQPQPQPQLHLRPSGFLLNALAGRSGQVEMERTNEDNKNKQLDSSGYYLVWNEPKALYRTVVTTGLIALVRFGLKHVGMQSLNVQEGLGGSVLGKVSTFVQMVVLPMLASACCFIQLIINATVTASGCAGFNKHLGPLRPLFVGILLNSLIPTRLSKPTQLFPSVVLAFLPEFVDLWNRRRHSTKGLASTSTATSVEHLQISGTVQLEIPTAGCVACVNKIGNAIQFISAGSNIADWDVGLHPKDGKGGGYATVGFRMDSKEEADEITATIVDAVESAGFHPCSIKSLSIAYPKDESIL